MPPLAANADLPTPAALLAAEDGVVLLAARRQGRIAAQVYTHGDFSEDGFLLYGRLEQLCAKGLLRFVSWSGDPARGEGAVCAVFVPAQDAA